MRYSKTRPIKILVLAESLPSQLALQPLLNHPDLQVNFYPELSALTSAATEIRPHIILLQQPSHQVLQHLARYQGVFELPYTPLIVIDHQIDKQQGELLLEAGFADFISLQDLTEESLLRSFRLLTQAQIKESEVAYLRESDQLTKVWNRGAFNQALGQGCSSGEAVALLAIDVDRLREFNRRLGYCAGDAIIRELCNRLLVCTPRHPLYRIGSDEFAIVLRAENTDKVRRKADRMLEEMVGMLHQDFDILGEVDVVSTSIGVAIGTACPPDELITQAALASEKAKQLPGCSYTFYEEKLPLNEPPAPSVLAADIWTALKLSQFELYYQPRIDLASGQIVGAEALMRWNHPERGLIMPDDFIPVSEHTGQIVPMGFWAIMQAGRDLKTLHGNGLRLEKLGINLSFRQFQNDMLAETIKRIVSLENIDTNILEFELTESSLFSDDLHVKHSVDQLCSTGIDFSLDDFGTGYSSFSLLQKLPVSTLKIDRSFVAGLPDNSGDAEIVRAIISLARNMKKRVIAEGVETEQQLAFLREHQCEQVQGFLYSKPVPLPAFMKMLRASASAHL